MPSETYLNANTSAGNSCDVAITVPTTPYNILIAKIMSCRGAGASVTLVGTGLPFTKIIAQGGPATGESAEIWVYVNPPAGAQTVHGVVSPVTANAWDLVVSVVSGANQTNPVRGSAGNLGNSNAPAVYGVPSVSGDLVIDSLLFITNTTLTPGAGQTATYNAYFAPGRACTSNKAGSTPTAAMAWTSSGSEKWCMVAVSIAPQLDARGRIVTYQIDRFDPDQRVLDAQGNFVAPSDIRADQWTFCAGRVFPTSQTYSDLQNDPSMEYNEEVQWWDTKPYAQIKGARGEMNDVIAARLSGGSTA